MAGAPQGLTKRRIKCLGELIKWQGAEEGQPSQDRLPVGQAAQRRQDHQAGQAASRAALKAEAGELTDHPQAESSRGSSGQNAGQVVSV